MPIIRIQQSFLLNKRFELPADELAKVVKVYQEAWTTRGRRVIPGLEKVTGLTFAPNIIDCYIVNPHAIGNISNPLIIGGGYTPRAFVHVLTHELIHILADDNQQNYNWHEVAKHLYPREEWMVANHIMASAVVEALYTEAIKDTDQVIWFNRHVDQFGERAVHARSWEIVNEVGYQKIMANLKKHQYVTTKKFA